jgi:hypothetical protein
MKGVPDPLADALHSGAEMRATPIPNLVGRNFRHGGLHGRHGYIAHQRSHAQHHPRQAVAAALSGHMLELADDRLQDFAGTQQPFVFPRLLTVFEQSIALC